jgi:hypothetical protein
MKLDGIDVSRRISVSPRRITFPASGKSRAF